ncbi:hypothetical protein AA0111_g8483 [Alternaria arborescens]|jgi:hypothetical protein|uniref:hypothetical protein n=1 Tax=Alternaria arborescens TaxID=156630 RepID=UPI00107511D4|nr:hypothetical protein AA0111_g8483 [Alternaria arborescens]RYO26003.1 hypothetical protein AA0111_g8483 [Alternaria arborescens]
MNEAPAVRYRPTVDEDGDEIVVKIDSNDPAFEWDDDEPHPDLGTATATRPSKPPLKATRSISLQVLLEQLKARSQTRNTARM